MLDESGILLTDGTREFGFALLNRYGFHQSCPTIGRHLERRLKPEEALLP